MEYIIQECSNYIPKGKVQGLNEVTHTGKCIILQTALQGLARVC